jgi:hypothetical protein
MKTDSVVRVVDSKFTQEYTNRMRKCSVFLKDNGGDIVARDCADEIDRLRNRLEALTAPVDDAVAQRDFLVAEYERAVQCGPQGYLHCATHLFNAISNEKVDRALQAAQPRLSEGEHWFLEELKIHMRAQDGSMVVMTKAMACGLGNALIRLTGDKA